MFRNVGSVDRVARVVLGVVLLALVLVGPCMFWGFLGIVPLFTGLIGFCPLYSLLGVSSTSRSVSLTEGGLQS
jgi:hypothetical protein